MSFSKWLQSRLTAHGFPCGLIDGIIGPVTIAAIKAFESIHGLPVNGTADENVVRALRASANYVTPKNIIEVPDRDKHSQNIIDERVLKKAQKLSGVPKNNWPRQKDVRKFYGAVGTNQTSISLPFPMRLAWSRDTIVTKMTLHKKVAASAERVFNNVAGIYNVRERSDLGLDIFSGSLNVRKMRGGSRYSMHSWGIAIDFDNQRNGLHWHAPRARLSHADAIPFWKEWEKEGWLSLGRARDFDWMHVQAARL